jgi:hypothetical protein
MTQPPSSQEPTATDASPGDLIALLERQHTLVSELAQLATDQAELIQRARTDELLALLTRRQNLIDEFTGSQRQMNEITGPLTADLSSVAAGDRARIEQLIDEIGTQLARVMACDERDQQALEEARGRTRQDLTSLDAARTARQAYIGVRPADTRFADQRG